MYILQMFWKIYSILTNKYHDDSSLYDKYKLPLDIAFIQSQKTYWTLNRFAKRIKKRVVHSANEDLYGTPLSRKYTIELIQDNCIYKFSIHDLVNIIKSGLLTVVHGYPNPTYPRNPYTNKEFDIIHMLSIYTYMWAYTPRLVYNDVLQGFYKANFNLHAFTHNNRKLLSIKCIEAMVPKNAIVTTEIIQDILQMLSVCSNPFINIRINKRMNKNEFYNIFRPFLKLYYQHRLLNCSSTLLKKSLIGFALWNPMFGRDYYDYNTKQMNIDTRHLNIRDCMHMYNVLAKDDSNMLKPIDNVYYFPLHQYNLTKTVLTCYDGKEYFTLPEGKTSVV